MAQPYRIVEIALVLLESVAICEGRNQNSGFLRIATNTNGDSAGALLEVSKQVEEWHRHGRSTFQSSREGDRNEPSDGAHPL